MQELSKYSLALKTQTDSGLYEWAINEVDEDGKPVGEDYISFEWTVSFEATSVSQDTSWWGERPVSNSSLAETDQVTASRKINIELKPRDGEPKFFIFGHHKPLTNFELNIRVLNEVAKPETADEDAHVPMNKEHCLARAFGDYTAQDADFMETEYEGQLTFYLFVSEERFAHYCRMLELGAVSKILFAVSNVDGFYAGWSPTITTSKVKILCKPDKFDSGMPHYLGEVGEADLVFRNEKYLSVPAQGEDEGTIFSETGLKPKKEDASAQHLFARIERLLVWTLVLLLAILLTTVIR